MKNNTIEKMKELYRIIFRNRMSLTRKKAKQGYVNLEWWSDAVNLGDYLAIVVYEWMLENKKINSQRAERTTHLMTIGSIVGMEKFDAVIWGSGIHKVTSIGSVMKQQKYVKYDIRAVRGPITRHILASCGYECDVPCGDPAVLLPLIYFKKKKTEKKYKVSFVLHFSNQITDEYKNYHLIDIQTKDYKKFIDELLASEKVISSSLHGIILAESYGIPAVFLNMGMDDELMKYYDWYYATDRFNVKMARTVQEALEMEPMELPDLQRMRENLIRTFPEDIYAK